MSSKQEHVAVGPPLQDWEEGPQGWGWGQFVELGQPLEGSEEKEGPETSQKEKWSIDNIKFGKE